MLEQTFIHVPGIGPRIERALWAQGCVSWKDLLEGGERSSCGTASRDDVVRTLERSLGALSSREHQYFARLLGMSDAWRAWPEFRDSCVYLDIETDGGKGGESVTTIGMFDGKEFTVLVKGRDLENFRDIISRYSMVVTSFGASFDLPMLQRRFRGLQFDQIHLDLCPTLRQLGIRGGLKRIEKQLGIARGEDTDGLSGWDAVRLWRRYQVLGDESALETLIAYNREDVVNLEQLAEYAYGELRARTLNPSPA